MSIDITPGREDSYAVADVAVELVSKLILPLLFEPNLLDSHQPDARQERHGHKQLPEFDVLQHG